MMRSGRRDILKAGLAAPLFPALPRPEASLPDRMLVIEHEEGIRNIMQGVLERALDKECDVVCTAGEALEMMSRAGRSHGLIIMRDEDSAYRRRFYRFLADSPQKPHFILTRDAAEARSRLPYRAGRLLEKPFSVRQLIEQVCDLTGWERIRPSYGPA